MNGYLRIATEILRYAQNDGKRLCSPPEGAREIPQQLKFSASPRALAIIRPGRRGQKLPLDKDLRLVQFDSTDSPLVAFTFNGRRTGRFCARNINWVNHLACIPTARSLLGIAPDFT